MKKLGLFMLSMFMLASVVQPVLGMRQGLTKEQFDESHHNAKWAGIRSGAATGICSGLTNGLTLNALRLPGIRGKRVESGCIGFTGSFATFGMPLVVGGVLVRPTYQALEAEEYKYKKELHENTAQPTQEQRKQLQSTAYNYMLGTDIFVTASVTTALASGVMSGFLGKTSSTEGNTVKNFCTVFPFALAVATVFKMGTYNLFSWVISSGPSGPNN